MREIDFHGINKYNPKNKELSLVADKVRVPKELALFLDENFLFIEKMDVLNDNPKISKLNLENKEIDTLFDGKKSLKCMEVVLIE